MGDLGKAKRLFKEILKERPLLIRVLHVSLLLILSLFDGYRMRALCLLKWMIERLA